MALIEAFDEDAIQIKNFDNPINDYRKDLSWTCNNSVFVNSYDKDFTKYLELNMKYGEPSLIFKDNWIYGRICDPPDYIDNEDGSLCNPCGEYIGKSDSVCNLSEIFIHKCDTFHEFCKCLRYSCLYCKLVSTISTRDEETDALNEEYRKIGISVSGICEFILLHG